MGPRSAAARSRTAPTTPCSPPRRYSQRHRHVRLEWLGQIVGGLTDGGVNTGTVTDSGTAATLTVNDAAANSFSGLITNGANALALTKTGAGTLTLSYANTDTGVTTINGGTLSIAADSGLGTVPGSATPGLRPSTAARWPVRPPSP